MEVSIGQRLKAFIEYKKMKPVDVANILGYPKQQLSSWMNNKTQITTAFLPVLLGSFRELNARWLLTGEGEMLESTSNKTPYLPMSPEIKTANEHTSPYPNQCTNPLCTMHIEMLMNEVEMLKEFNKALQNNLDDLRQKGGRHGPGEIEGGVDQSRITG